MKNRMNTIRFSVHNGEPMARMMNEVRREGCDGDFSVCPADHRMSADWDKIKEVLLDRGMDDAWKGLLFSNKPVTLEIDINECAGYIDGDYVVVDDE